MSIGGYAVAIVFLIEGFAVGQWPFPGGDVVDFYGPAGDAVRAGGTVYFPGFLYGPPWAIAFGAVSWVGPGAIHAIVLALDLVALWVVADRDLRRLGWLLYMPLIPFEMAAGQLNLLIAAAIVAAQRGRTWPLAVMTLAKVWPALALPFRDWRPFVRDLLLVALVTIPFLSLWPAWIESLVATSSHPLGPVVPVPFLVRAPVALALLLVPRAWARALAASIVSPGLYWGQLVVLVAPISLFIAQHQGWPERDSVVAPRTISGASAGEPHGGRDVGSGRPSPRGTTAGNGVATSGA